VRAVLLFLTILGLGLSPLLAAAPGAEEIEFDIPAQAGDRALLTFAKQARVDILFSFDALHRIRSNAVVGRYQPEQALELLLRNTHYVARKSGEAKWIITPAGPPSGTLKGKILAPDGSSARRVRVGVLPTRQTTETNDDGSFEIAGLAPGNYTVFVTAEAVRPLRIENIVVEESQTSVLTPYTLQRVEDPTRLEPFVVQGNASRAQSLDHSDARFAGHVAGGNLDLTRTESDVLPYMIFNRTQIARSGVVNLNDFLQRELIDSSASTLPPEKDPNSTVYTTGSTNLSLRGYNPEETVILVNGRRLPEVMTSMGTSALPPDVNFIPLSLVQQVEVLPVSASSLYTGNAVGGVINIVLRPDVDANATEITATYTNALSHFDAPQSSLSILHARTLLDGTLRLRVNANFSRMVPATEAELGLRRHRARTPTNLEKPVFGATPNVRSIRPEPSDDNPTPAQPALFTTSGATVTSVAPGADGQAGLAGFKGREGVLNTSFFDSPGSYSTAPDTLDFPYGREQRTASYYGSVVYDIRPWLQLATDITASNTTVHRGYEVMQGDLTLRAASPLNPFQQDVQVSLNETATALGENYREARLTYGSLVFGALLKLPADWRLGLDTQYSHNVVRYRALLGAKVERWQQLVDQGLYNPLRDTQVSGPPPEFYDRVLIYTGGKGRFVTLGDYDTIDAALRLTNERLQLPTGQSTLNVGTDYRRNHLASYHEEHRFGDGQLADDPIQWGARSLARYSFFGELQTPFAPLKWRPSWIRQADADLGLRYVASSSGKEANFAPTYGAKFAFPGGFAVRGSITTSSRFPTPTMSRRVFAPSSGGVAPANIETVTDYRRNGEEYSANVTELFNPDLRPEEALTETAGVLFERGQTHRMRAAIDFVETHKLNEEILLGKDTITANETLWPERVVRAPAAPGQTYGLIQAVYTGRTNLSARRSQNWTASLDYRWNAVFGGTFESYARVLYFQRYRVRVLPNTPSVDELGNPDGVVQLLKYRANFGASWSNPVFNVGADGHYFHSRLLPKTEWAAQGRSTIRPYWQADLFAGCDIARWLPGHGKHYGLRVQARINNVLASPFPKWINDPYDTGIQVYGDWRGRAYSLSLTATF
jgi:outer membrane receptor protein involved in Fe transport